MRRKAVYEIKSRADAGFVNSYIRKNNAAHAEATLDFRGGGDWSISIDGVGRIPIVRGTGYSRSYAPTILNAINAYHRNGFKGEGLAPKKGQYLR